VIGPSAVVSAGPVPTPMRPSFLQRCQAPWPAQVPALARCPLLELAPISNKGESSSEVPSFLFRVMGEGPNSETRRRRGSWGRWPLAASYGVWGSAVSRLSIGFLAFYAQHGLSWKLSGTSLGEHGTLPPLNPPMAPWPMPVRRRLKQHTLPYTLAGNKITTTRLCY